MSGHDRGPNLGQYLPFTTFGSRRRHDHHGVDRRHAGTHLTRRLPLDDLPRHTAASFVFNSGKFNSTEIGNLLLDGLGCGAGRLLQQVRPATPRCRAGQRPQYQSARQTMV
jgi:hypothetical protein